MVTARINKEVIPVQALSGDKLEKLAAHSVADAIRYFSGVQMCIRDSVKDGQQVEPLLPAAETNVGGLL